MSSLYNKEYLNTVNKTVLDNIINGTTSFDPTSLKDRKITVVLQHYLIKYIEENGKTDNTNRILKQYYTAFAAHPYMFVDSPLITTEFVNRYMPQEMRNKIINYRDQYFDGETCKKIYEKSTKYDLSNKEKNRLYSYLIRQMNKDNKKLDNIYTNCAKNILLTGKNIKDLNDMELKFYCAYIGRFAQKQSKVNTEIHIMENEPKNGGFECAGLIFINKNTSFAPTLEEITQVVCHETQHRVQEVESVNNTNRVAFEMARHQLFNKYLYSEDYDVYHLNYHYSDIELDAELNGFWNSGIILGMLNRRDLSEKVRNLRKERFDKRHYYEFMLDKNKKPVPADWFVVTYLDEIIKNHPEELDKYKVLKALYNENGSRRSFSNISYQRMNQTIDDRGLYDNYINYGIINNELEKLDLTKANIAIKRQLYKALGDVFKDKALLFKDYCEDTDPKVHPKGIEKTTLYQLSIINKIITYIDKNMDSVLETREENKITNSSFIFNFIYDFRDFELNNINNKVIEQNPEIQDKYNRIKDKVNSVTNKINRQYIKDRIKDFPIDKLNKTIKTPEGVEISLNDYLFFDILPRLDAHQNLNINNKEIHISDIIRYYNNELNKTIQDEQTK